MWSFMVIRYVSTVKGFYNIFRSSLFASEIQAGNENHSMNETNLYFFIAQMPTYAPQQTTEDWLVIGDALLHSQSTFFTSELCK